MEQLNPGMKTPKPGPLGTNSLYYSFTRAFAQSLNFVKGNICTNNVRLTPAGGLIKL